MSEPINDSNMEAAENDLIVRPLVARRGSRLPAMAGMAAICALGVGVFAGLDARRSALADPMLQPAVMRSDTAEPQPLPMPQQPPTEPAPAPMPPAAAPPPPPAPVVQPQENLSQRYGAPTLIVDFGSENPMLVKASMQSDSPGGADAGSPGGAPSDAAGGAAAGAAQNAPGGAGEGNADSAQLNDNERFANRIGGARAERVRATRMSALDTTIPQGAIIDAVLETAINSDLPGYARALVASDVMSFDGSEVLIPRGSRVIGQYKSATALGTSRVFVIWSRVIRPDGVSVMLGSPATDELGRAGLGGKVDRHFLQRFGGAILLSILNAGLTTAAASVGDSGGVYIGSAADATNLAGAALKGSDIPPTIKTPQGAAVRIFVAKDLDFSGVGPAR